MLHRLRLFIRDFLPLLRHLRQELDLLIVTADKGRVYAYERLLTRHRAILKLGVGELQKQIKTYAMKPPVPSVAEVTWPTTDENRDLLESEESLHGHACQRHTRELISE